MKLILVGFEGKTGSATHFSQMASALKKIQPYGQLVSAYDIFKHGPDAPVNASADDVVILFKPASVIGGAYIIKWAIFETEQPPKKMIRWLDDSSQVWVPSDWGRNVLIDNGVSPGKVVVIHEGVNPSIYHQIGSVTRNASPIKLLSVAVPHYRKGLHDVIASFLAAGFSPEQVTLTLKVDSFSSGGSGYYDPAGLLPYFSNPPNVRILNSTLSASAMATFYRSHHAYVGGSRGEGWGLPVIEAAACGLPIVSPIHSALTQFLSTNEARMYAVNCRAEVVNNSTIYAQSWIGAKEEGLDQWCVVDKQDLTRQIRNCVSDIKSGQAQLYAKALSDQVRSAFSWDSAAELAWKHILQGPFSGLSLSI